MMKRLFLFTLCFAMLAALFGCSTSLPAETTQSSTQAVTEEVTEEMTEETKPEIPWEQPAVGEEVTLLFDKSLENEDGEEQTYQVPLLSCKGGDSEAINQEIEEYYTPIMERVLSGRAPEIVGISYVLNRFRIYTFSLLICCDYADGSHSYSAYTLSLNSGHLLNCSELLQELNISEENFLAEAKTRAAEVFEERHDEDDQNAAYRKQLNAFCSDENINLEMQVLSDNDGHLMLISPTERSDRQLLYYLQKEFEK